MRRSMMAEDETSPKGEFTDGSSGRIKPSQHHQPGQQSGASIGIKTRMESTTNKFKVRLKIFILSITGLLHKSCTHPAALHDK
jgi:hypothetical protein